jgi:rhamnulokinase
MNTPLHCAAVDLGATSGRVIVGTWQDGRLDTQEAYRFPNQIHRMGPHDYWDIPGIWTHVQTGLAKAAESLPKGETLAAVGVDTWGCDHVLVDREGRMVFPPHAYRDDRTQVSLKELQTNDSDHFRIYRHTGIPAVFYNTSLQLAETVRSCPSIASLATRCLLLPDYFNFLLSGKMTNGQAISSTTQLLSVNTGEWSAEAVSHFRVPAFWFESPVAASTRLGHAKSIPQLRSTEVVSVPGHDTACAFESFPSSPDSHDLFISTGTWSLVGFKSPRPLTSKEALDSGICNERAGDGQFRPLTNIVGLWLLEKTLDAFDARPTNDAQWADLINAAAALPTPAQLLDIHHDSFVNPASMRMAIDRHLRHAGGRPPESLAGYVRVICDSLGHGHAEAMQVFAQLAGRPFDRILMVGGGSKNKLLCQATANAAGVPVVALEIEGAALGNLGSQLIALGALASFEEFRARVIQTFAATTYSPASP